MRSRPLPLAVILCVLAAAPGHALDTNGNGMSDVWELLHHQLELFPNASPFGPLEDADGDGRSNLTESIAGTDPFSGLPPLGVHGIGIVPAPWPPNTFRLTVPWSLPGKTYTLSTSPDLSSGSWTPFDPMAGTGAHLMVDVSPLDAQTNTLAGRSFFRCDVADQPNPGGVFSPWELAVMGENPLINASIMALVNPPGTGNPADPEEPPVIPNSDGSGPTDPYDASPFDDEVDWRRTPEAKYLHIPVDGSTGGFKAVDVSDSGKILFTRTTPVVNYTTDPVGLVWDPSAESAGRLIPVMFAPENFQLNFRFTEWNPNPTTTLTASTAPLPGPDTPPTRRVVMNVLMKAIAEDGSLIADVAYTLEEDGGNPEQETRSGHARLAFLWRQEQYGVCRMLGENRGYRGTVEHPLVTEDYAVGFHTSGATPVIRAVHTHQILSSISLDHPSTLSIQSWSTTDLLPGYGLQGHPDHKPSLPPDPVITPGGRILIKNRVSASALNRILCGTAATRELPYDADSISDLPDHAGSDWGVGMEGGPFRKNGGEELTPVASLTGVLAFDRQGNGIGDGVQGRAIWRNARWHTLEAATGVLSLAGRAPKKITASGLIWISDATSTLNALLVPVEIVAPTLDHAEDETEYGIMGADELKVAKMEHSLTGQVLDIGADRHRFHVRIPSRLGGKAVVAKLGTSGNPEEAYNDPATEIPLTANPFQQESQSQLLVSDQADDEAGGNDEQAGDRTHRVQLGGDVEVSEIRIGSVTYPFSMKVPVKVKKRLSGRIVMVGNTGEYQADIEAFNKVAKERYAQVGVDFDFDIVSMALPSAIQNENNVQFMTTESPLPGGGVSYLPNSHFAALVDKAIQENLRKTITVFVVRDMVGDDRGRALIKATLHPDFQIYGDVAVLSAVDMIRVPDPTQTQPSLRAWFTLAHEVGHILTEAGHYGSPSSNYNGPLKLANYGGDPPPLVQHNLMKEGTSNSNKTDSSKRLRRMQEFKFKIDFLTNP